MNEFKVGDRVKFKEKYSQNTIYEVLKIDKENIFIDSYPTCWTANLFELIERKIGDHWFKPHELYIIPYAEPPKYQFDKNKCGHTNYEGMKNMDKKEEFKIDKLGWYEILDEGNESKYTGKCIFIDEETKHFILKIDKNLYPFDEKGYCTDSSHHIYKRVIKYLGPELPNKSEVKKIYLVSHCNGGGLQDYTIIGAFLNYETAKEVANKFEDGKVEELDLDKIKIELPKEPRKFEFETQISHMIGLRNLAFHYPENISIIEEGKYKIIMKEIIE